MKFLFDPTFLGILTIILSVIGIVSGIQGSTIVESEHLLGGIFGLIPGILLLLKNKKALLLGKIWAIIQIPYYVVMSSPNAKEIMSDANIKFAVAFHNITFYLSATKQKFTIVNPTQLGQEDIVYGINLIGVILLILFIKAKLPAKK